MKTKLFLFGFVAFAIAVLFSSASASWQSGSQIFVKVDLDGPELWEFSLSQGSSAIHVIEEDGLGSDDECDVDARGGTVLQRTARFSDIQVGSCRGGGDEPQDVLWKQFGSGFKNKCGNCALAATTTSYMPKGDLYRSKRNLWILCDSSMNGQVYVDTDGSMWQCQNLRFSLYVNDTTPPICTNPPCDSPAIVDTCQVYTEKGSCENRSLNLDCAWCAKPYLSQPLVTSSPGIGVGAAIPYLYPSDVRPSEKFGCFNIAWGDPFNCGGCGIKTPSSGINPIELAPASNNDIFDYSHFCVGTSEGSATPYCSKDASACEGLSNSGNPASSVWFQKLKNSLNPYFYYNIVPDAGGYKSVSASSGASTQAVYTLSQVDSASIACSSAGGTLSQKGYGCCGDGKPHYDAGPLCQENRLCDGNTWHDATEEAGTVFKLPDKFAINYPVAGIDGIFTMCVDEEDVNNLAAARSNSNNDLTRGCVPGANNGQTGVAAEKDYYCPAAYGFAGGNTVDTEDSMLCTNSNLADVTVGGKPRFVESQGVFFCNSERDDHSWGQAYLFSNSGRQWPFNSETAADSSRCPGSLADGLWGKNGERFNLLSSIGCPGKVTLSSIPTGSYPGIFGNGGAKIAGVCLKKIPGLNETGYFNQLNFVSSDNVLMGAVNGHEYMCTKKVAASSATGSKAVVAICCGNSTAGGTGCNDILGTRDPKVSQQYYAGQFINVSKPGVSDYKLYCKSDGKWGTDLDNDLLACSSVTAGSSLTYTGKYCCSEGGDDNGLIRGVRLNESYSDAGGLGGCFINSFQPNDQFLKLAFSSNVFVKNGTFQGCIATYNSSIISNTSLGADVINPSVLINIKDNPNPGSRPASSPNKLINFNQACTAVEFKNSMYLCEANGIWTKALVNRSHISLVPSQLLAYFSRIKNSSSLIPAQCCQNNQCWDSSAGPSGQCINEQLGSNEYYKISNTTAYKCLNGEWGVADVFRYTSDGCNAGFCPASGQCLYNPLGSSSANGNVSSNPQCINSGQFAGDDLCLNGSWSSRSRFAASALANLVSASDDYVLSCGEASEVLINPQTTGNINKVCVLELKPGTSQSIRLFATSINQEIELGNGIIGQDYVYAFKQSFLSIYPGASLSSSCLLGVAFGTPCITGNANSDLGGQNLVRLYYDSSNKVVVFSDRPIGFGSSTWYSNICAGLPSWLAWMCPAPSLLSQNISTLTFDKVHIAKIGNQEAFGVAREDACACVDCPKEDKITFRFKGYSQGELATLIGHPGLYTNINLSITSNASETIILASSLPSYDISGLWHSLSFLKVG